VIEIVKEVPKYTDPETNILYINPNFKNTFINPEIFKKKKDKIRPEPVYNKY